MRTAYDIVIRPIITEQSMEDMDIKKYVFEVAKDANQVEIAKAIEDPFASADMADMFKAACSSENAVKNVADYSTKVADSDGGRFAKMHVFDSSLVDDLLKVAETIESNIAAFRAGRAAVA